MLPSVPLLLWGTCSAFSEGETETAFAFAVTKRGAWKQWLVVYNSWNFTNILPTERKTMEKERKIVMLRRVTDTYGSDSVCNWRHAKSKGVVSVVLFLCRVVLFGNLAVVYFSVSRFQGSSVWRIGAKAAVGNASNFFFFSKKVISCDFIFDYSNAEKSFDL